MSAPYYFVFDVESVGLHGDAFAVGWVVIEPSGKVLRSELLWCDPAKVPQGFPADREWVADNVPAMEPLAELGSARLLRDLFWQAWDAWRQEGAVLAADVAWPVEARFLLACVADNPSLRAWRGPYPLIDIASVRFAKGFDALAAEERRSDELPTHNPLADARQSARLLVEALSVFPGAKPGRESQ